ncbi:DISARM system helicase DrmA [Glycomyces sp. L485]|uniref:DISARM system helicase DrmA n=1 Tax=Glycomyces sp. L485 TaxID=2909235 RepID=UPI001F4B11B9|nr:DISARM system helicase DrmA [Glycomyces sp. L485]MCH7231598.1 DISARM system helicase DrmA [Glycomyces sp. L485]
MASPSQPPDPNPQPSPAEMLHGAQHFEEATSFGVRDGLIEYLNRDLLGPWDGDTETFRNETPRGRYLVGQLGPKTLRGEAPTDDDDPANDPDEQDDGDSGTAGTEDAELPDRTPPVDAGRLWASSMGLSFKVSRETDSVHVTADWGQYEKVTVEDEDGKGRRTWQRTPVRYEREIPLEPGTRRLALTGSSPDEACVLLHIETRHRDDCAVVDVSLVNGRREPRHNADEAWLFQPRLTIRARDGAAPIFLPLDDPLADQVPDAATEDAEEMHLRLLYRNRLQYVMGRNVAARAETVENGRRAHRLVTEWVPVTDVPGTSAPSPEESEHLAGLELSMAALAEADTAALKTGLAPLADGYAAWLDEQADRLDALPAQLRPHAEEALLKARKIAKRIAAGVHLLTDDGLELHHDSLRAFRFAQKAMLDQRIHTQVAARRAATGEDFPTALAAIEAKGARAASWRPFQLAFLLLNLAGLADPGHKERQATRQGLVDLLFFPTGGGKTEAYLGLAAFTLAMRRLQGVTGSGEDARDAAAGVAVFMRYTLRLLTSQQFQRASSLVCAAELQRRSEPAVYGEEPFRIGLWVGMKVTPNTFQEAADDIAEMKDTGRTTGSRVLQLQACPWCGEPFDPNTIEVDLVRQRVLVYCSRNNGSADRCPFSRRDSPGEGVPVVSVDEEIYRLLPAFMIATVDKLAQLPWKGEAGMLFGLVDSRCPRHGYRHPDLDGKVDCGGRHNAAGSHPAVTSEPVVRPRPWDLIIQDELHLISGALGTSVALFESAVDYLLQWPLPDGRTAGPKIVASTATTKRSASQVRGIYNRDVALFPPPVLDIEDTFFSRQDPVSEETPGRRYLGLCAHGVRLKQAEIRLWDTLLIAGQAQFDRYGAPADPYMTPVGYFNATRELAGMRRYLDDDVSIRIHRSRDGFPQRLIGSETLKVTELTSRIASKDIAATLADLEVGFDPECDTSVRKRGWRSERMEARRQRRETDPRAVELSEREPRTGAVLATSMLQVGVDVSRFGLMVVTGQPKNTAEYIQASSRVGRDAARPGLVVTLYNWTRPRDLDHFEDFFHYHAGFYRQVEALSVTPFTRRSLDRGATGTLVAAIRQSSRDASPNPAAAAFDRTSPEVRLAVDLLAERAEDVTGAAGSYLRERAEFLFNAWEEERSRGGLVYRAGQGQTNRNGLLEPADGSEWGPRTVANSMRETEGEAKLVFPRPAELLAPPTGLPQWTYPQAAGQSKDGD